MTVRVGAGGTNLEGLNGVGVGGRWLADAVSTTSADFLRIIDALPEVVIGHGSTWSGFKVRGNGFGYLWERTQTVGLKQTLAEQQALVAERPEVFEVQFTTSSFGWVVVSLEGVELDELAELTFEAWRLTAPADLVSAFGDQPPDLTG